MHVPVRALRQGELQTKTLGDGSEAIRQRVEAARNLQLARQGKANHQLSAPELETYCELSQADKNLLEQAIEKLGLSTRAYHRVLKLARYSESLQTFVDVLRLKKEELLLMLFAIMILLVVSWHYQKRSESDST